MDGDKPREIRIGNSERSQALEALGEHFTIGRLDQTEYEERVSAAAAAKTRTELSELFTDLPEPTPFGPGDGSATGYVTPGITSPQTPARGTSPGRGKKIIQTLNLFAGGGTVILFFILLAVGVPNAWLVFILFPLLLGAIGIWSRSDDDDTADHGGIDHDERSRRRDVESRRRKELGY